LKFFQQNLAANLSTSRASALTVSAGYAQRQRKNSVVASGKHIFNITQRFKRGGKQKKRQLRTNCGFLSPQIRGSYSMYNSYLF